MISRRHALRGVAAAWASSLAWAQQPGVELPPEPAPARALALPRIIEQRLDNGLLVVLVPRHAVPLVHATLLVRAGPELDPPGQSGLAAMTSTLLTKGAWRRGQAVGAVALARQAEALGASLASGCGPRATTLALTVTPPHAPAALALLADMARTPLLAADELAHERKRADDGFALALGNPGSVAALAARRAFWPDEGLAATPTPASLQRLQRDDVVAFHAAQYHSARSALVLVGDLTAEQGLAWANTHFGGWGSAAISAPQPPQRAATPAPASTVLVDMPGSGQSGVVLALPLPALGADERRIGQVANAVLGLGYSSRLSQEIRIRKGWSYDVRSELDCQPEGCLLLAQAQTGHGNAAGVVAALREQLARLSSETATPVELAARQAALAGSFARRLETVQGLAGLVLARLVQGRPLDELALELPRLLAVTPAQVRAFAQVHFSAAQARVVVAGDATHIAPQWAGSAGALQLPLSQLDLDNRSLRRP